MPTEKDANIFWSEKLTCSRELKKQALLKAQVFSVKEHRPSLIQTFWKGSLGFAGREGSAQVAERVSGKLYWPWSSDPFHVADPGFQEHQSC